MPENVDNQEASEIKENHSLTEKQDDDTMKKLSELETKINDFYLKPREPLKDDPVFELFEKMNKTKEE